MKKIQMVDLISQYEKMQEEIDKAVLDVIRSSAYINGPEVKAFQSELEQYLDVKHVIPCANGTDALQIAMMGLGLKPGDEVITANFTYVATAEVIALLQLTPVLVDVDPATFNIDIEAIKKAITPKTKAIVPVHLFGQAAPMEEIMKLAEEHDLFVIEDTAQAIGADYTFADGKKQPKQVPSDTLELLPFFHQRTSDAMATEEPFLPMTMIWLTEFARSPIMVKPKGTTTIAWE